MRTRMEQVLLNVQQTLCRDLQAIDGTSFREDRWEREEGGFGLSRVMQHGMVFEKAGVNTSTVYGTMTREAAKLALGSDPQLEGERLPFFTTSISLIIHPHNPMAPTSHAHYRYFEVGDGSWSFAGSADLTPSYLFEEDATHFHRIHKQICDHYNPDFYPGFKKACDAYFYLSHRQEHRGVGGIFLGNLNERDGDQETLFSFTKECVESFSEAYLPIVKRRKDMLFTEEQKNWQRLRRGRYVEFNLVCDRGTAFGLKTGGRVESILMSLPLVAGWEYEYQPQVGSAEERLVEVLRQPREWV